jgi:peptidoglycan-associated lipoprotein
LWVLKFGWRHAAIRSPAARKTYSNFLRKGEFLLKLRNGLLTSTLLLVALTVVSGCHKSSKPMPTSETAPSATAPTPTAQLTATPTVISAGDQVQLAWRTTDATSVSIEGIGDVPSVGVKTVTPTGSTTYHLVARGDGGSADASARVTVNAPPAIETPSSSMSEEEMFKANMKDIFFDYDNYDIRTDAQSVLAKDADYLMQHPNIKVVIGGYCDERGSDEYNLVLGQNRAQAAKTALVTAGVSTDRIRVISFGKEKPFCTESNEECWQLNRRDGFAIDR